MKDLGTESRGDPTIEADPPHPKLRIDRDIKPGRPIDRTPSQPLGKTIEGDLAPVTDALTAHNQAQLLKGEED